MSKNMMKESLLALIACYNMEHPEDMIYLQGAPIQPVNPTASAPSKENRADRLTALFKGRQFDYSSDAVEALAQAVKSTDPALKTYCKQGTLSDGTLYMVQESEDERRHTIFTLKFA